MAFRVPQSIESAISSTIPQYIITMGCREECPVVPGAQIRDWDLPDPAGKPLHFMRDVRDQIENRVKKLINELT